MTPAGRIAAAIEVFSDIEKRHRPANDVLKDWGLSHRFAGSGDRAAVAGLVFDALRRRSSAAFIMGAESPRAIVLGMLRLERDLSTEAIGCLADGSRFAPAALADEERARLETANLEDAPFWIAGDYPEWLDQQFASVFGEKRGAEGAALARRAPLDLRVNTLKADREKAAQMLSHLGAARTRWSPVGLRIPLAPDAKSPAIHAEPAFLKGMVEIQDEGSQISALLAAAQPGEQVIDLCAGAGGKALALSAAMKNRGQIYAIDRDKRRLAPIHARIARAGARNIQVRTPRGDVTTTEDLRARADLVFIDAPCTGSGAWRRNPDAKWRLRPGALAERLKDQAATLAAAAPLVRTGGRLVYVTCSILPAENGGQVAEFLSRHQDFEIAPPAGTVSGLGENAHPFTDAVLSSDAGILMTPRWTGTDGFFVSVMIRRSES